MHGESAAWLQAVYSDNEAFCIDNIRQSLSQIDFDEFLGFQMAVEWSKHFTARSENATHHQPRKISDN
jgi:hypothetical protein